jgi:hypothetical protein
VEETLTLKTEELESNKKAEVEGRNQSDGNTILKRD